MRSADLREMATGDPITLPPRGAWLYHVTYFGRLAGILKSGGLAPGHGMGGATFGSRYAQWSRGKVFVSVGDRPHFWYSRLENWANYNGPDLASLTDQPGSEEDPDAWVDLDELRDEWREAHKDWTVVVLRYRDHGKHRWSPDYEEDHENNDDYYWTDRNKKVPAKLISVWNPSDGEWMSRLDRGTINDLDDAIETLMAQSLRKDPEGYSYDYAPNSTDLLYSLDEAALYTHSGGEDFWGDAGAGVLPIARSTGRILVGLRSQAVNEPGEWGVFGGAMDSGEQPRTAAEREMREELGYRGTVTLLPAYVFTSAGGGFRYSNFVGVVDNEFEPRLDWETERTKWVTLSELRKLRPIHFGLKALLQNSMGLIRQNAMAESLSEAALTDIPGVKRIVDTATLRDGNDVFGNAAAARGGHLLGWHVTDDPDTVKSILTKRVPLQKAGGKSGDMGAGFYVSAMPRMWINRSADKWSFLDKLNKRQIAAVAEKLLSEIEGNSRYSENEQRYAARDIGHVVGGDIPASYLSRFGGMPYGIPFWEKRWLKPLGIKPAQRPVSIRIKARGRFAEVNSSRAALPAARRLKRAGVSGAFVRGGFADVAQMVIWDPKAIVEVGRPEVIEARKPKKTRKHLLGPKHKKPLYDKRVSEASSDELLAKHGLKRGQRASVTAPSGRINTGTISGFWYMDDGSPGVSMEMDTGHWVKRGRKRSPIAHYPINALDPDYRGESLRELFDPKPGALSWSDPDEVKWFRREYGHRDVDQVVAFNVGRNDFVAMFSYQPLSVGMRVTDEWFMVVDFALTDYDPGDGTILRYNITGAMRGKAPQVFGLVGQSIKDAINITHRKVRAVVIRADEAEPSRVDLYRRLTKLLARRLGWAGTTTVDTRDGFETFVVYKTEEVRDVLHRMAARPGNALSLTASRLRPLRDVLAEWMGETVTTANSGGDCYEAAVKYLMDHGTLGVRREDGDPELILVHGEVSGQGPLEGVRYGHAWIERGMMVIDTSNGRNLRLPKALYYGIGNIGPNVHKYTVKRVREKLLEHRHYGPWDLKTSSGL